MKTALPLTAPGAAILGVIDAHSQKLLQLVPTLNVPARVTPALNPHPAGTAHSVAANAGNNHVFVPLAANNAFPGCLTGCIADLATKQIFGYRTGDKLAGGQIERIEPDRVVIMGADGPIEIMLHRPQEPLPVVPSPEEGSPRRFRGRQE